MELFNADTNESICRNVPTFGNLTAGAVGGDKRFEEDGCKDPPTRHAHVCPHPAGGVGNCN